MKKFRPIVIIAVVALLTVISACVFVSCNEKETKFTVTFTGEGVDIPSQTVAEGGVALEPKAPEREGYKFTGWYVGDEKFSFETKITADITLTAGWEKAGSVEPEPEPKPDDKGTKENPYVLTTADDIIEFSDRVNHPEEEENAAYYKSWFRLDADIDMDGYDYMPAGQEIILDSGETVYGFSGVFDGNGHKISNLTIEKNLERQKTYYVGFFGLTDRAIIKNLTLENINYDVKSYTEAEKTAVSFGGVVGEASLTEFYNVSVSGILNTRLFPINPACIGGIAGRWEVSGTQEQAYIAHMQNCHTETEVKIGRDSEGAACSLDNAFNGGMVGLLSTSFSSAAIINCVSQGKVYGGKYVGGIIGYASGDYISMVNCVNYAPVTATAVVSSNAGGLVACITGNSVIADSLSLARVKGARPQSGNKSYVGSIAAQANKDSYDIYYDPGLAVVNSYYVRDISANGATETAIGIRKTADEVTEQWIKDTLKWEESDITFIDGKARPVTAAKADAVYKVTVDGTEYERQYSDGDYSLLGLLEDGVGYDTNVFFDYVYENGERYRFFMPVTKDITLAVKYGDVSAVAGVYTGTSVYGETKNNVGVLVLNTDGTINWINSSSVRGTYKYDGEHIILDVFDSHGEMYGASGTDSIVFITEEGSYEVTYTFVKTDLKVFGEYYASNGDMITFGGEADVSMHIFGMHNNNDINGTYVWTDDNTLTVTGGNLAGYYNSLTITVNADMSLTVNGTPKDQGNRIFADTIFNKTGTPDYSGRPFVGEYRMAHAGMSSDTPIMDMYIWNFSADGTVTFANEYVTRYGQYAIFDNNVVKTIVEGHVSTYTYDEQKNIFYGENNRGMGAHYGVILTPAEAGDPKAFVIDGNTSDTVIVAAGEHYYLVKNKVYDPTAEIVAEDGFTDKARVTIDGVSYRVLYTVSSYNGRVGYALVTIGAEEGTYTYNGQTFTLDGIGGATGAYEGKYYVYGNTVVIVYGETEFFGFDYTVAHNSGNVAVKSAQDKYAGMWLQYKTEVNEDGEEVNVEKYRLLIDGYGHIAILYYADWAGDYRFNWGNGWVNMRETETGIYCEFNENYKVNFMFYYDMNLIYTKDFGSTYGEMAFTKRGYDGPAVPPEIPSSYLGSYTGVESDGTPVVFNIKQDFSGSYKNAPIIVIYDGSTGLYFSIGSVNYFFRFADKVMIYGEEQVALTRTGEVSEVIPGNLCGTWSGKWEGYGTGGSDNDVRQIVLEADGTLTYITDIVLVATFDAETLTVTASNDNVRITMVYDPEHNTMKATVYVGTQEDGHSSECNAMTKVN